MRRRMIVAGAIVALIVVAVATAALAGKDDMASVKKATAAYHDVAKAEAAGYEEFLDCFESQDGGMGQHYVDVASLDAVVEIDHPEAMVYEVKNGLKLVAVEYIVPADTWTAVVPPKLYGQEFHMNTDLGVWVLHAWVWRPNPSGMFADWNPSVGSCPA